MINWRDPGNWGVGTYQASCSTGGRTVATGSFEIVDGPPTLESIKAKLVQIRFFEMGTDPVAAEARQYDFRFAEADKPRYIAVEIRLSFPALEEAYTLPVACTYIMSDGRLSGTMQITFNLDAGQTTAMASRGFGTAAGGSWREGRYRVACFAEGKFLGEEAFQITGEA